MTFEINRRDFCALAAMLSPVVVAAQEYPTKPIRIVLGGSAGAEPLVRILAAQMSKSMGQPIIVEPVLGAGGYLATEQVSRAAPDGYTILLAIPGPLVNRPVMVKLMKYDPIKDFTPLSLIADAATVIVVHGAAPFNTIREMITYAKAHPGELSFGTTGVGTSYQMAGESMKQISKVDILHVPFKANAQLMTSVVNGDVSMVVTTLSSALPFVSSSRVKLLALANDKRSELVPNLPSIRETLPAFESPGFWIGFIGPAGMPPAISTRLSNEIVSAISRPEIRSKFEQVGFSVVGTNGPAFAQFIKRGLSQSVKIARAAGIKPE